MRIELARFMIYIGCFLSSYILSTPIIGQSSLQHTEMASKGPFHSIDQTPLFFEGRVLDSADEPVSGAVVSVSGTVKETVSDRNGRFRISGLPPGFYTLEVQAFGFPKMVFPMDLRENISVLELKFDKLSFQIPEILLLGQSDRQLSKIPGSGGFINQKEIKKLAPLSGNEIFRRMPGIHVVDEEGLGMRINVGIRGLDPDRSRSVLIMEDGIPVALAPYGEPEMYYTPTMDRMSGVEVLKGSGQILYGPQTIGGVINYLSLNPPSEALGTARITIGQGGYFNTLLGYGNTVNNIGYQVNFLKKRADQIGLTGFDINDLTGKFVLNMSEKSTLSLKAGLYDESSNSTYIGLTQTMFDAGGQDFTHMAPDDELLVRRISGSLSHEFKFNKKISLKTTAFAFTTTRDWQRQDFALNGTQNNPPANWTGVTWGDESIPNGAVYMRNSTGNRNRSFFVSGLDSRLQISHSLFGKDNQLTAGIRYLHEVAFEKRINGTKANAKSGNLVSDEIRTGNSWSAFIQNTTDISNAFSLHYGARLEHFDYSREILREQYRVNNVNQLVDTSIVRNQSLTQLIPGGGFTWQAAERFQVFGGVHRGFAPPRTKDAISNTGDVYELDAELSTNYELGFRSSLSDYIKMEITGFYMNFSNQIIPVSESSGGTGAGLINGGSTIHKGVEAAFQLDISSMLGMTKTLIHYDANVTLVDAYFGEGRRIGEVDLKGNKTPYAPSLLFNTAFFIETASGISLNIIGNYVSRQFGDPLNTITPNPEGRIGEIPAWFTIDGMLGYRVNQWNTIFRLSVKNMTNERFIASRRPQGIRLGIPRYISGGVEIAF